MAYLRSLGGLESTGKDIIGLALPVRLFLSSEEPPKVQPSEKKVCINKKTKQK